MKKIVFSLLLLISINIYAQNDEDRWVDSVYNTLTLEQRVGQLFNLRANDPNKEFNDYIDDYIERYNVGGVTFFRTDAEKLLKQANEWQSKAQTPMMIAPHTAYAPDNTVPHPGRNRAYF